MRSFILGTDWWSDCDDIIALRILARAHKEGEINLKAIGINACMKYSVASVDAFLKSEGVYDIPLGLDQDATDFGGATSYQEMLSVSSTKTNADAEDAVRLYRRILAKSDEPIEIIEIGYMQVIANVLQSGADDISDKSGVELVKEKVTKIWAMAGKWDENPGYENNFTRAPRSRVGGSILCKLCPVPITFLGWEVGADVLTATNISKDDILYPVLCIYNSEKIGRASWDPMVAVMAIIGDEEAAGYDVVCGSASVEPETGANTFMVGNGIHKYVKRVKEKSYYADMINERIK